MCDPLKILFYSLVASSDIIQKTIYEGNQTVHQVVEDNQDHKELKAFALKPYVSLTLLKVHTQCVNSCSTF